MGGGTLGSLDSKTPCWAGLAWLLVAWLAGFPLDTNTHTLGRGPGGALRLCLTRVLYSPVTPPPACSPLFRAPVSCT
ncbi:hypothetical protein F4780DRAFT_735373 [Xylariomycetidae sp. FL0641]|nr:hypothetical protein F4780DRAFT_735373 [Xylariomycetidae sp. FL0641]